MVSQPVIDVTGLASHRGNVPALRVGNMAAELVGSEILKIATEIRALVRGGRSICNLTVGDFDPRQFPIPVKLERAILAALERGETNYPPSDGVLGTPSGRAFYGASCACASPWRAYSSPGARGHCST
jgi:aspartate aminotransferase